MAYSEIDNSGGDNPGCADAADAIWLLKRAVSIRSYSGEESELACFLVGQMDRLGFRSHIDKAGNAIGIIGAEDAAKTILFAGHMDTVPGEIKVRVDENSEGIDVLYGRGSVDAKGPLCAFISGAARARQLIESSTGLKIIIAGCVEEECASSKGARYLVGKYKPDMIVIGEPSGTSGITLGYKGRLNIRYSARVEGAHGASEVTGAGEQAVAFFNSLQDFTARHNKGLEKSFERLQLRLNSMNTFSDGLFERAEMGLSFRIPPGFKIDEIIKIAEEKIAEDSKGKAHLEFSGRELPIKAEKNNSLVRAFVRGIREEGLEPCFKLKTGTSDMNVLGNAYPGVPILAYGPGDSNLDHTPDEHMVIEDYLQSIRVISLVINRLVN